MAHSLSFRRLILALQAARRQHLQTQQRPAPAAGSELGWNRRRFVKTSVAAGIAGLLGQSLPLPASAGNNRPRQSVAIIGAGIAGLNAAYRLRRAGITATVYEARNRPGGRMLSTSINSGLTVDLGAELINTDHHDMRALAKAFDIPLFNKLKDARRLPYPKETYFFDGVAYSEAQLALDLADLAWQINDDAGLLDSDWDTYAPAFDQLSVADYLDRHADKISQPYVRALLENAIRTEYGVEAAESSALQLLFLLPVVNGQTVELLSYSDEAFAVQGGSASITDALAASLAGQIQFGTALHRIERHNGRYTLHFADRSHAEADIVIITLPFPALRQVDLQVSLPARFRRFIAETDLGVNEKLIAGFDRRFWHQPNGFGLAAWTDLGFAEVWDESQRQPRRTDGALNFFLGGDQARQFNRTSNFNAVADRFIADLDRFVPGAAVSANGANIRSAWGNSRYTGGGYANFAPGQLSEFADYFWVEANPALAQQVVFDRLLFAGEHLSDAYFGFMEGGAQTGRLAADYILREL